MGKGIETNHSRAVKNGHHANNGIPDNGHHGIARDVIEHYRQTGELTGVSTLGRQQRKVLTKAAASGTLFGQAPTFIPEIEISAPAIKESPSFIREGTITLIESKPTDNQPAITSYTTPVSSPDTDIIHKVTDTTQDPPIREETRGVRLDMFLPENAKDVDEGKLADEFFGITGRRWLAARANPEVFNKREVRREKRILGDNADAKTVRDYRKKRARHLTSYDRKATEKVNTSFTRAVASRWDIGRRDAMDFAEEHLDHSAKAQGYALETMFGKTNPVRQHNESILPIEDPADVVTQMSSPRSGRNFTIEMRNRFLRGFISADIATFNRGREHRRKLSKIQGLLNEHLFAGLTASTIDKPIRAIYDDVTNAINFVEGVDGEIPEGAELPENTHVKTRTLPMRPLQDSGLLVYTNPSEKEQSSSIIKAIKKALGNRLDGKGELISGADEVQDINRIMFAVLGNEAQRDELLVKVFNLLVEHQDALARRAIDGTPIKPLGDEVISDIYPDDKVNGRPGQSDHLRARRIQVVIEGQQIEMKFQTVEEYFEEEYEVGHFDKQKAKFTGNAHSLYRIQRLFDIMPYLVPKQLKSRGNLKKLAIKKLKAEADRLKGIREE